MDQPKLPIRTDDIARRIEYVTHGKWTAAEYQQVVSILRLYRHESMILMLERAATEETDRKDKGPVKDGKEEPHG
jgi:hypothetical protein